MNGLSDAWVAVEASKVSALLSCSTVSVDLSVRLTAWMASVRPHLIVRIDSTRVCCYPHNMSAAAHWYLSCAVGKKARPSHQTHSCGWVDGQERRHFHVHLHSRLWLAAVGAGATMTPRSRRPTMSLAQMVDGACQKAHIRLGSHSWRKSAREVWCHERARGQSWPQHHWILTRQTNPSTELARNVS